MLELNTPSNSGNSLTISETVMPAEVIWEPADLEGSASECVTEIQNVCHAQTQIIMKTWDSQ